MAKEKYLIVSDCRIDRRHVSKGDTISLDMQDPNEAQKIALLNHAGRIALHTPENVKAIEAEIKRDKEREEMLARQAAQNSGRQPQQQARATA